MIEFELDIPSLSEEGIEMEYYKDKLFEGVRELHSSSMIDWLIMIEMLIVLIGSFDRIVVNCELRGMLKWLLIMNTWIVRVVDKHYLDAVEGT